MEVTGRIAFVLALIVIAGPVFGGASGLNIIPTADVLDKGTAAVEIERSGRQTRVFSESETAILLQLGMGRGIEFGHDNFGDGESFGGWNVKKVIAWRNESPAAAVGVQNIGNNLKAEPYAVGNVPLGHGRFHAGLIGIEGSTHPMFGYDQHLVDRTTFQVDYIAGNENAGSVGLVFILGNRLELTASYVRNNVGPNRDNYLLTFSWFPSVF